MQNFHTKSEFWFLLSLYIQKLASAANFSSLEHRVLPLLERLNFLTECQDLASLERILDSLQTAGFRLPLQTRKALSTELVLRAFKAQDSPCKARQLIDYAKRNLDCSFYALREAIVNAQTKIEANEMKNSAFQIMSCVVEEEVCWNICDENRLLQFVMEDDGHDEGIFEGEAERSRLAGFLRYGLQSQQTETRLQALRLAVACSFHSHYIFSKLIPIFEASLYLEDFDFRLYVLQGLMDLIFMHHRNVTLGVIAHLILPFLNAPTAALQLTAVIGCGRLLLFDCFPDETECLLNAMFERYVYNPPVENASCEAKLEIVVKAMHCFFQEYTQGKKLHQDEIANTLVYMCLEKIEEGIVVRGDHSNPILQDNLERKDEAKRLHLAVSFGLSISDNILDAVVDSLVLNIEGEVDVPVHAKNACRSWFLGS